MISFLIKPKILQVETTNDCNSNCEICMRTHLKRPMGSISFEEFKKLPLNDFNEVALHGWGECLLHPDIFKMVSYAKSLGLKTSLCSNGSLLDKRLDELLKSGLDEIAFGIYSLDGKEHILNNIKTLVEEKNNRNIPLTTYIDITMFKDNLEHIPEIIDTGIELGVNGIVLHRLFDIYGVNKEIKYGLTNKEEKAFINGLISKYKNKINIYPPLPHTTPCRILLNCMFIRWDCMQSPCVYLTDESLGDARTSYNELRKRHLLYIKKKVKKNDICKRCIW
ncbi:radical SAM protein [Methanothermococcus sp.]|uniref:radical SAM protein n=1 Tax=Methanothermococcus sp. TaxID=2614238 RepID=UPI0025E894F1|nr:radical SAM protein [Methanothermococcus sp.]